MQNYIVVFGDGKTMQTEHKNKEELKDRLLEIYKDVCFYNYENYDLYVYKNDIDITESQFIQALIKEIISENEG